MRRRWVVELEMIPGQWVEGAKFFTRWGAIRTRERWMLPVKVRVRLNAASGEDRDA